ncbi:120 protein in NOF-FB transposable element [Merluccius polli]|uniref:120 protein in NOF-FB transposable element n=1 Tax=Merluccius polli TaxID=89951 RepID=A0AA47NQW6_MERPO|nr:120 protein in NOF-FB transposable element [Merluccius polli]
MCEGGRLHKKSKGGLSNTFYKLLSQTPQEEIRAGNLTRCLNRGILNAISCEVRKSLTFHDNVVLEVLLTQKIMRECNTTFVNFSGYIQHFQADPFATHMYSETGVGILVGHMRRKKPVKLYLDATGSVVSKIPDQKKRVLYYALVLAGHGRGAPPLPVAEMLTNNHTVPSISHWLLQFLHTVRQFTVLTVSHVETDFSWALMPAVLLSFNKENIFSYLRRCFAISQGRRKLKTIKKYTVLHLCSAHVLKAITGIISKHVTDKGHREFLTFVFARLQNTQSVDEAIEVFRALCIILFAKKHSPVVQNSVEQLTGMIRLSVNCDVMSEDQAVLRFKTVLRKPEVLEFNTQLRTKLNLIAVY